MESEVRPGFGVAGGRDGTMADTGAAQDHTCPPGWLVTSREACTPLCRGAARISSSAAKKSSH